MERGGGAWKGKEGLFLQFIQFIGIAGVF